MANVPISNMTATWTDSGTTYTAVKMNVTDTASNAASLLMDLQVGGTSKFNVAKSGFITFAGHRMYSDAAAICFTNSSNVTTLISRTDYTLVPQAASIGWGNLTSFASDLSLARDAANTLAQRNATNAQAFRVYNTYTDASNYERGFIKWNANVLEIGAESAGTGTPRNVLIKSNSGVLTLNDGNSAMVLTSGDLQVGARTLSGVTSIVQSTYHQMTEMTAPAAPAANNVRIYAEDNGSGKTRLMALFPTGVAQQIAIEP